MNQLINIITGLNGPHGIAACDNAGDIVIAECNADSITILNKEEKRMKSMKGQFNYPSGVAMSNDDWILVTDNHRIQKLTTDGVCVKSVGSNKSGKGQFQLNWPCGIVVHPTTGEIFVVDKSVCVN